MRRPVLPVLLLAACVTATAKVDRPARRPVTADPCAQNFSGRWVHETDESYTYLATDDGGTLELLVQRRFDGGLPDAGPTATVILNRPSDGGLFSGEVRALGSLKSGQVCELKFPAQVLQCGENRLMVRSASQGVVGEGCQTPARPRNPAMLDHLLTRADAGGMRSAQ